MNYITVKKQSTKKLKYPWQIHHEYTDLLLSEEEDTEKVFDLSKSMFRAY